VGTTACLLACMKREEGVMLNMCCCFSSDE
jgi:hypothetical protein